jgi:hypothetical protein
MFDNAGLARWLLKLRNGVVPDARYLGTTHLPDRTMYASVFG